MAHSTTPDDLDRIIQERVQFGMPELLLAIADYFYCIGAGIIPPPPLIPREGLIDLIATLEATHRREVLARRGWDTPPPNVADELPGWLLRLSNQADTIDEKEHTR